MLVRVVYFALGLAVGAVVAALAITMYLNDATKPHRVHVPLAWEGIVDNHTLGV